MALFASDRPWQALFPYLRRRPRRRHHFGKVSRAKLCETIENLNPTTVAMEACASSHFWGRRFRAAGRCVRLINPRFVKAFVKGSKNDATDAEAIYEAATRPTMRFVPVKSVEQPDLSSQCIARGSALSTGAPRSSTTPEGSLLSMAFCCRRALGVLWRKRLRLSPPLSCRTWLVTSSTICSSNSPISIAP